MTMFPWGNGVFELWISRYTERRYCRAVEVMIGDIKTTEAGKSSFEMVTELERNLC